MRRKPGLYPGFLLTPWLRRYRAALTPHPAHLRSHVDLGGGNLAINTGIAARDQGLTKPVTIVSVYPVATTSLRTPSKQEHAGAMPLNTPMIAWFVKRIVKGDADTQDPRLNLAAANLKGLPPVTVINAEIDPLRSDGDMMMAKLKETGVDTTHQLYTV